MLAAVPAVAVAPARHARVRRRVARAARRLGGSGRLGAATKEAEVAYENCDIAYATASNATGVTVLKVESKDFPGLVRVIAYVLNGLGLAVTSAQLSTCDEDGVRMASNTFTVCTQSGAAVSDLAALEAAVAAHASQCAPTYTELHGTETLLLGNSVVCVQNSADDDLTTVRVKDANHHGALLEAACTLSALGCEIVSASIDNAPVDVDPSGYETGSESDGGRSSAKVTVAGRLNRTMLFRVSGPNGGRLDFQQASGLLYACALAAGQDPTAVPL